MAACENVVHERLLSSERLVGITGSMVEKDKTDQLRGGNAEAARTETELGKLEPEFTASQTALWELAHKQAIATSVTGDVIVVDIMADGEGELEASSCEKSRKRVRNDEKWKRKRAKVCRNLGLEYVSDKTRKIVPAKQQGVGCSCSGRTEQLL
ncbi:hypothetical protein ANN_00112 [Periplaneta americana]|uniref:Uncharacterized protein n=1 Tax=Periplaneta americana TaxID=6978 RepID=A0ABQ8TPV3_PERAM|nr:hypothetical protein ANN_00112 [Periplaneta americana]